MPVTVEWRAESAEQARRMEAEAERMASELGRLGAELVVLFGSRARGEAEATSDIDLMAVMPCDPSWTFPRRLAEIGALVDPRCATDLLVYTPAEMAELRVRSPFVRRALAEGRVLFPAAGEDGSKAGPP